MEFKQKNFTFTKNTTNLIKGIAIIFMIVHHFLGYPEWIMYPSSYTNLGLTIDSLPIERQIARTFCEMCVGLFLFLTGYGTYFSQDKPNYYFNSLRKLMKFLFNYWIIMFLFLIPIKLYLKDFNFDIKEIILNAFGYDNKYVKFAWYVRLYTEMIIFFPLLKKFVLEKCYISILTSTVPFILINMFIFKNHYQEITPINFLYEFLFRIPVMIIGYNFAKFNIFNYIKDKFIKLDLDNFFIYNFLFLIIVALRVKLDPPSWISFDIFYVPILIFSIVNIIDIFKFKNINNGLIFLGKHSLNIWFLHSIFFSGSKKIQYIAYYPKNPFIIIVWVFILTIPLSFIVNVLIKIFTMKSKE
ncbi:hypothetical protein EXM65_10775 [Clostridium botulinum]|uniref:Acyltransferase 3 domain-containing protein n=1 Tax=Clostridium botulinum TaxID=1491 RepID=A0A6M0SPY1_CLOBO|nr:hypothetical protein [Clostridium botulinum]